MNGINNSKSIRNITCSMLYRSVIILGPGFLIFSEGQCSGEENAAQKLYRNRGATSGTVTRLPTLFNLGVFTRIMVP